ncbi:DMT family transporter [Halalkalibacter krulwichiae]|uniref:Multidrug resistance protein YkkD n=1 Tax=Halalkalibacter krulwichiae TaxID=199441 RepID=A0A1X9MJ66_9BACI|nr:multidrug efflux SMR transporter [Halalkalibacter krulwichiae]ARK32834.1 Multidrug resistance protein YkkD [Halalkalibacter krulwichiae]
MEWMYLIFAGLFEVAGVAMINQYHLTKKISSMILLIGAFASSFYFLSLAMAVLPMAIAYAVWTGIGACGGVLIGMLFFGESKHWKRILFLTLIVTSAIGLKSIS